MEIFTDSSFNAKLGIAGIGLYIKDGVKQRAISNYIPATDNNQGEIFAIYIASILMNGKEGTIYTDSQTALAYIRNEVREKPRTREQYERHQRMKLMGYKIRKLGVKVEWTKAHCRNFKTNSLSNNMVDLLAKSGVAKFYER